ncbi:MAG: lysine transporter LysE [Chlamydiae bacterium CG10_big_fil_rev_8_21_14_0_10_35_9]|nr:MAG: lysine transporter LysE [Chlamydiae bacterium CG10_big_fil_rev_8_21_14_0_10_35_9]
MEFLVKGIFIGFAIAAPVGPIGILCIKRTLQYGRIAGLVTGLGAALADTFYGIVAAFGLTAISFFFMSFQFYLKLLGGFFLLYLGIKIVLSRPSKIPPKEIKVENLLKGFLSSFFLTITNPLTILSFIAVFTALGLSETTQYLSAALLVVGVLLGSGIWWLFLSEVVTFFRKRISEKVYQYINYLAGLIIGGFGLFSLLSAFLNKT